MTRTGRSAKGGADSTPGFVAVAYSGGRDSTALLHATACAARDAGLQVLALHVHHGLSRHADAWLKHCRQACKAYAEAGLPVRLLHRKVRIDAQGGASVEALAREARYGALARMARGAGASIVLLAHHRGDQAETFLLQALRGAGVAGLASMPDAALRGGITWARPWLRQPRAAIEAYVARHGLAYIDDDSNADARWARNRLRLAVWPALQSAFPQAEAALSDAAAWAQEAAQVLQAVGDEDLARCAPGAVLELAAWLELPAPRRSNALRLWFARVSGQAMPASLATRLMSELAVPRGGRWPAPQGHLASTRGLLAYVPAALPCSKAGQGSGKPPSPPQAGLQVRRAGRVRLRGWGGVLLVERVAAQGVALSRLGDAVLAERRGGESFQLGPGRPARALKKQYQALGLDAAGRGGPLVFCGGQLVFVPGLGVDARAWAAPGEAQVSLRWLPDPPVPAG